MKLSHLLAGLAVSIVLTFPAMVRGETSVEAFDRGNTLLAKGGFQEALRAYAAAVRAQRTNQQYVQQFMLVRRVIALRENLDRETDLQRWQTTAQGLHAFYVGQGIYSEALLIDKRIHAKLNTALSAAQLAETQLAMGKTAGAAEVLAALDPKRATAATRALLAIALARQGRMGQARKISEAVGRSNGSDPGTLYSLARMHAVVGNDDEALGLLVRCFEAVPPSRIDGLKTHAKRSPDFARLASTSGFAGALETKSKIAESKCSGGSSCAGCPMRGNCPKSQGK